MKQVILICMLLLLLQGNALAQSEETYEPDTTVTEVFVEGLDDADDQRPEPAMLTPDSVVYRLAPDTTIQRLKKQKQFAYANDPAYWVKDKPRDSSNWLLWLASQKWFSNVIWSLLFGLLVFAIAKIIISNRLILFKNRKEWLRQQHDDLMQKQDLRKLIQEAEQQGDLRLAIRYWYMKTLQDMDERGIIQLNARSTNWDYVNMLGSHPLKKPFLVLTRAYEYVWYGEFNINQEKYGYLKTEFQQFEQSLRT